MRTLKVATPLVVVPVVAATSLPHEVERFLIAYVPSVATLEAILLLRKPPARSWSVAELADELFIDARQVSAITAHLITHGFAMRDEAGGHRYAPTDQLASEVDLVATTYRMRLVAISQFIHERQDSANLRNFADAFRFRKD